MERKSAAQWVLYLKGFAERKNVSHKSLARRLGVSPVTLSQWLQGHRKLREDEISRLQIFFKTR